METFLKVTFLEVGLIPVTFNVSSTCLLFVFLCGNSSSLTC